MALATSIATGGGHAEEQFDEGVASTGLRWYAWIAAAYALLFIAVAVVGPLILPYDAKVISLPDRLLPPGSDTQGGIALLGTDQLGRDLLRQVVSGARVSLVIAVATIVVGGILGAGLGVAAGFLRGKVDAVVMRVADIQFAFPATLLAIIIAGVLGSSMWTIVVALAVTRWVFFARVARASALTVMGRGFVESGHVVGASRSRLLWRYVLPFCTAPLIVLATTQIGLVVIAEASLSFLGLGVPADQASWGTTIANGRDYLSTAWWISTIPGLALASVVLAVGVVSDSIQARADQRRGSG